MDAFKQFIAKYPSRTYKKGETILLKGDRPKTMFIIESGMVKTYSLTVNGDERLVSIDKEGEDFPIGFAIGLVQESEYFYEAFSKCIIRLIPKEDYVAYVSTDVNTMYKRHIRLTALLLSTLSRIHALEQSSAGSKIAYTLLYMADQLGVVLLPYDSRLKISVTQQEIANASGLTRETAHVELKKLEMLKLIAHSRHSYILYMDRLQAYIDEQ